MFIKKQCGHRQQISKTHLSDKLDLTETLLFFFTTFIIISLSILFSGRDKKVFNGHSTRENDSFET